MTLKDYEHIQWYINWIFWLLELTIVLFVIRKRKQFSTFLFICFLVQSVFWFHDTNFVLLNLYKNIPKLYLHSIQAFSAFYSSFLFFLVLFYHFITSKKVKFWIIPIAIIGTLITIIIMYYNITHNIYFTHGISILDYIIIVPLCIYGLFQINPQEQNYKWNLSPSYLFYCATFIEFIGNSSYELFNPIIFSEDESVSAIILTIRLFIWIAFCLFFIAGLYQLGREKNNTLDK